MGAEREPWELVRDQARLAPLGLLGHHAGICCDRSWQYCSGVYEFLFLTSMTDQDLVSWCGIRCMRMHGPALTSFTSLKRKGSGQRDLVSKHIGMPDLLLQQKSRDDGFVQEEAAGMSPRQQVWGMPAHPHARKEGRRIPMTRIAGSGQIPTTSFLPETGRERKRPAPLAGGASLDLMCEACQKDLLLYRLLAFCTDAGAGPGLSI